MYSSTDVVAEHQHQLVDDCPHAVASTIIQRHRSNRQRFDSADYEMARRASGRCAGCTCGKCYSFDLTHEPEAEPTAHRDELRCLRLQRFDSADWALKIHRLEQPSSREFPSHDATNVAHLVMARHALKCCAYVGPRPVENSKDNDETIKLLD